MEKLDGKVALITGGNSGIGMSTAKLFIAEGAKVAITGRNQTSLNAVSKELGSNILAIQADAAELESMEKAVSKAVAVFGKLDVVFANAEISSPTPLGGTDLSVFEEVLKINVTGVFCTVQAALPYLKDRGFGHIKRINPCNGWGPQRSAYEQRSHQQHGKSVCL
ncbi:NAD(P)-dependent dehydrogenase (short-subunit alcohol dehydrogenase family) [Paenibacillus rhizosphaerae]|uniref:NAD(P)-dependent dehydrogenase (Short-subunit alcohol dehydrogenase family) n=1 Tax=Paenibacillus rhizosphaerae TaxID=297318 RepID=A0A839TU93_9BACL|nr:SDR family NAD(P)-dependent oxidoreductase [Paenibacillus rhizosphaerae]MBB3130111.1 NAD(P)-dependent dehydrogenase (short-subunit alcohol dehydrogenase family) [Paenibacillus rhizosphaerae]